MPHLCIKPYCGDTCSQCNESVSFNSAIVDVLKERQRQKAAEGYSTTHDDEHTQSELARAAASYLCRTDALMLGGTRVWPKGWTFKPADYRRVLVKALALGFAELERHDRQMANGGQPHSHTVHSFTSD